MCYWPHVVSAWFILELDDYGCLRKKYGVGDYQYLTNDSTQQCGVLGPNTYNLCQVVCQILTKYVKYNLSYELMKNDESKGTG